MKITVHSLASWLLTLALKRTASFFCICYYLLVKDKFFIPIYSIALWCLSSMFWKYMFTSGYQCYPINQAMLSNQGGENLAVERSFISLHLTSCSQALHISEERAWSQYGLKRVWKSHPFGLDFKFHRKLCPGLLTFDSIPVFSLLIGLN